MFASSLQCQKGITILVISSFNTSYNINTELFSKIVKLLPIEESVSKNREIEGRYPLLS